MTNKRQVLERMIERASAELLELDQFGDDIYSDGAVLKFQYRYGRETCGCPARTLCPHRDEAGRIANRFTGWYTFVAVKIKGGWYISGKSSARLAWDDLVVWWARGEVRKMKVATGWAKV